MIYLKTFFVLLLFFSIIVLFINISAVADVLIKMGEKLSGIEAKLKVKDRLDKMEMEVWKEGSPAARISILEGEMEVLKKLMELPLKQGE